MAVHGSGRGLTISETLLATANKVINRSVEVPSGSFGTFQQVRKFMITAALVAVLALSSTAFAQQPGPYGTADEAKAMLLKAVAAVKADKAKALDMFNKGEGGFLDRDLYPFCANISD
jgi:hypothetical protein